MPKQVKYNGQVYSFPDDATDAEIAQSLDQHEKAQAAPAEKPGIMSRIGHGIGEAAAQLNPVTALQGMAQLAAHPIDTLSADNAARMDIYNKAANEYKQGNYASGLAHGIYAGIPLLGPNMDRSADQFESGDIAGGVGSSIGQGVALALPEKVKGMTAKLPGAQTVAAKLYQSVLKPGGTAEQAAAVARTGLNAEVPISEAGQAKLGALIDDLNAKVKAQIAAGGQQGATISKGKVLGRLNDLTDQARVQVAPSQAVGAIQQVGDDFANSHPGQIPVQDAQAIKQGTYRAISKSYGEQASAAVEAQKALTRGIKEELEQQFPEIKGMNAQEGKLYQLDDALDKAVKRISNRNMVGLKDVAAGGGAAMTAALTGGGSAEAVGVGTAATILNHVLQDPTVQSKLAIMLSKGGKGMSVGAATARVAGYVNALGNAANAQQSTDPNPGAPYPGALVQYR